MHPKMKTQPIVLLLTIAALSHIPLHAASITWGAPQQISNNSDVSTNGTLVGAFNFAGPATAVNGINFQAFPITGNSNTVGNYTLASGFSLSNNTSSAAPPFSNLSAPYQSLLGTAAVTIATTFTLTMNGLIAGETYEFQTWVNDSRSQIPPGFTFKVDVTGGNNTVTLDPNTTLFEGGLGQYAIGTFLADSTSQQVTFVNSEAAIANGFQLRQVTAPVVPEPGTALFGFGLLSAAGFSRRGRR